MRASPHYLCGTRSATPLGLLLFPSLDEDVARDGIPGVMNADEEQQQGRRCNAKQGVAHMGASRQC